ncbi:bifunctional DNA-formamidopyrimidine glycosylase/DNA-(apurinic or apyrimidinic site) lyase [Pseudahrensia aquimaris]|uniref:Formamidopyrimidine-DNA glycosylase n=1 Tax=Pseudahrensia aquimaris TaxID=744461 RepID=A0ABW3FHR7_9HYPH
MPELPEVETVRRGLAPVMEGATVERLELRRPDLRFPFAPDFERIVSGSQIVSMGRRAKYLLADLASGDVIIMHLGMSGSFRTEQDDGETIPGTFHHERSRLEAHDHVVFHLKEASGGTARVIYNDPRRFGFMLMTRRDALDEHPTFKGMGVEPVGNALSANILAAQMAGKKAPLKAALLDQRVIAGLGNIYVCEALWRAKLSPKREARTLVTKNGRPTERLERLTVHIREVIASAIEAGGSSLRDHAQTDGSLGYFQHTFNAYDREGQPCAHGCGSNIKRIVQSGRSTFYCGACQR